MPDKSTKAKQDKHDDEAPRPMMMWPEDLRNATRQSWGHVQEWVSMNEADYFLARMGDVTVRLTRRNGHVRANVLDRTRMKWILANSIEWLKMTADGPVASPPPSEVAAAMLVEANPPLPELERIISVPIIGTNGEIHDKTGYDAGTKCFYEPAPGLKVPTVRSKPTAKQVTEARDLLLELVYDFPFDGPDDGIYERSHALGLLLLPFVRTGIEGATPLHLIEAPTPGSGKTLLAEVLAVPTLGGRQLRSMTEGGNTEEWRKRLTATLLYSSEYVLLDNLRTKLDSSALASIITAGVSTDRMLGHSRMVELKTQCGWIATANNPLLSDEMTRRTIRTRLDPHMEFPEERSGWVHSDLKGWTLENRGELVAAALTLARGWIVAGQPEPEIDSPLGMFEQWTHVIGGIIEWSELGSILGNRDAFRAANRDDTSRDFLAAVWKRYGKSTFATSDVADLAREHLPIDTSDDSNNAVGYALRGLTDRLHGGYSLRQAGTGHTKLRRWYIENVNASDSDNVKPLAALFTRKRAEREGR